MQFNGGSTGQNPLDSKLWIKLTVYAVSRRSLSQNLEIYMFPLTLIIAPSGNSNIHWLTEYKHLVYFEIGSLCDLKINLIMFDVTICNKNQSGYL